MTEKRPSSWQDEPTVVEVTDATRRQAQSDRKIADLLDDVMDAREPERAAAGFSIEALIGGFGIDHSEVPILVGAATPLLYLAHILRYNSGEPDPDELKRVSFAAVRRYERDLASAQISPERARAAHYIICATVDDVVLSKPWGSRIGWARSGLVSTFHNDVTGGDRVFDLLDHFHQSPGANKDLLLLIYLALSLAFEGRTRVSPRGALELSRIRDSLYKTLLGQYGVFERELSPHWKGVQAKHKPLKTMVALWTFLSIMALILAFGYLFFTLSLNGVSDKTYERLAKLPPHATPSVHIDPPPVKVAQAPPPIVPIKSKEPEKKAPAKPSRLDNLLAFLQPEVQKKLVTLSDANGKLRIRINNSGLFDTGSAEVKPDFQALLARIGGALAADKFRALVTGFTDNVPIKTAQFPSNWHLSEARAKAVGDILAQFTGPDAILTEGRADSDPLASNDTPEGREINRRTEILVLTNPDEILGKYGIDPVTIGNTNSSGSGAAPGPQTGGQPTGGASQ